MKTGYVYFVYRGIGTRSQFFRHSPDYHYSNRVHYGHWGDLFMNTGKSMITEEAGAAQAFDSWEEAQAHIKPTSHSSWKVVQFSRAKYQELALNLFKPTR
ncbi:hypothetical protein UFOVP731_36 [uncultured Caudovirales phage]|uniref:Uncharacterized protein n=1 Tax=uncultured Caudovirales phage TaxID=2100421 RepID=A0A6J5NMY0_9CAUD|nr:hypothetical protein UFOVP731_36 [uncultured Caudovirales phage]